MDLSDFADRHLGSQAAAFLPDAGPSSFELFQAVQSESHTQPLIGSLFWPAYTRLNDYSRLLRSVGLHPAETKDRQEVVVRHGPGPGLWSRYDLVVFDSRYRRPEPAIFTVDVRPQDLAESAADYWRRLEDSGPPPAEFGGPRRVGDVVAEAAQAQQFHVLLAAPPPVTPTAIVPAPAWEVVPRPGQGDAASAGVVATDATGRTGVTSADHAFRDYARSVQVAGVPGTIRSRHALSDSCFIELHRLPAPAGQAVEGPLSRMSPREGERVTFHGAASGAKSTVVTGWDKGLPFEIQPWNRLRVFTEAVTNPGDSGAALLAGSGEVIGFAFDRTRYGAQIEYSAWIWAEFVYRAHGLR